MKQKRRQLSKRQLLIKWKWEERKQRRKERNVIVNTITKSPTK